MSILADFSELVQSSFLFGAKSVTQILMKNVAGKLALRNAADSADAGFTAGAITGSGIITTQSGEVVQQRVVTAAGAVTVATTDYQITVNKTVGAATVVNLPASPATGTVFVIHDGKGDAATNNITITPNAGNINGASTLVLNTAYATATVTYNGTQWDAAINPSTSGVSTTSKSYYQRTVLYDNTLGSAGTWDVSGLDQTYDHLEVYLWGRSTWNNSGGVAVVLAAFNGDATAANYTTQLLIGNNTSVSAAFNAADSQVGYVPDSGSAASSFGALQFIIQNYTSAQYKAVLGIDGLGLLTTTARTDINFNLWKNTAAINRIGLTINNATNTFVAGSRLQIIGIKAESLITGVSVTGPVFANPLPTANGGTGIASPTANSVLIANGSSAMNLIAPSTSGNVLTSNGTTWASSAPVAAALTLIKFNATPSATVTSTTFVTVNTTTCRLSITTTKTNTVILLTGFVTENPNASGQITYFDFLLDGTTNISGSSVNAGLTSGYYTAAGGAYITTPFSIVYTLATIASHTLDLVCRVNGGSSIVVSANAALLVVG